MFLFSVINFTPSEPQPILAPSRPLAPSFLRYFTHCSPFLDTSFLRGMECNRENLAIPIIIIIIIISFIVYRFLSPVGFAQFGLSAPYFLVFLANLIFECVPCMHTLKTSFVLLRYVGVCFTM